MREWAIKEALDVLLRSPGDSIDPADSGLQQSWWARLHQQHQALASALVLVLRQGERAHEREQATELPDHWEGFAIDLVQQQQQYQQDWQRAAYQSLQEQRTTLYQGHQVA